MDRADRQSWEGAAELAALAGQPGYDSIREIQGLNRGADRLALRERCARHLSDHQGPPAADPATLSLEDLRVELVELSVAFIQRTFAHLWAFLGEAGAPLLTASPDGGGFAPLAALPPGPDPLTTIARHVEVLMGAMGRFCEHQLEAQLAAAVAAPGAPAPELRVFQRYRDLLLHLNPPRRPTEHGVDNGLAGLQVVLALCEVARGAYAEELGRPPTWAEHEAVLLAPAFERLVLAVGATRSRASNCLLAELAGEAFWSWRHSLRAPHAARLRFAKERFYLAQDPEGGAPTLQLRPEALAAVRRRMAELETPGRSKQLMCPAFFAETEPGAVVIQDFVRWILAIVGRYHGAIWP